MQIELDVITNVDFDLIKKKFSTYSHQPLAEIFNDSSAVAKRLCVFDDCGI